MTGLEVGARRCQISLEFAQFARIFPFYFIENISMSYCVLGNTEFYRVLLVFTWFDRIFLGLIVFYPVLLGFYWDLLGFTGFLRGFNGFCWDLMGFT